MSTWASGLPAALRREVERRRGARRERPDVVDVSDPGQESVWDYPRPPRVERVAWRIRVEFEGLLLVDSRAARRVVETSGPPVYYVPPRDVRLAHLEPSDRTSLCEWKGTARYFSIRVGDHVAQDAAWSYPEPFPGYEEIRDQLAFFAGKVDACRVGDERVTPQPGGYYGGWVTRAIVGPFKGQPGSERW